MHAANYTLEEITHALKEAFASARILVRDDSHQHIGHSGHVPGTITHIHVTIGSDALAAQPRIAAHRAVNHALSAFFARGLHAVAIAVVGD